MIKNFLLTLFVCISGLIPFTSRAQKILFFASHEQTYYSELIVAVKGLEAAGYTVDIVSANAQDVSTYMVPNPTTIEETANTLFNSSYGEFTTQFPTHFGEGWQAGLNATPDFYPVSGSIHDIADMTEYDALVLAGGTGILAYRVDGQYESQGSGDRLLTAAQVQLTAEKLNELALDALSNGKPVLAQCHGASLPVFWRIPGTSGAGSEILGFSLLKDQGAAGYPDAQTETDYLDMNVAYNNLDRVRVSSPHSSFAGFENGKAKIITSRDWYPQTVAHAARTLLNILESYPTSGELEQEISVLIMHGGAVDPDNCGAANHLNDVPCNYGTGNNLPADYSDIENLLNASSTFDHYQFNVSNLNLASGIMPFDANDVNSVLSYLEQFQGVVFFKHWSTGITDEIQQALKTYADNGGGIVGLHHALYNDIDNEQNKNILVNEVFGMESAMSTWSASLVNYQVYSTNYGHFVSTYGVNYFNAQEPPLEWENTAMPNAGSNLSHSTYQRFPVFDEIYNNMVFVNNPSFGHGVNQICPLFSNDQSPLAQMHTTGFVKLFNPEMDESEGRIAYFEIGERKESINISHVFGQVVRNAVFWTAMDPLAVSGITHYEAEGISIYPNPTEGLVHIKNPGNKELLLTVVDPSGRRLNSCKIAAQTGTDFSLSGKSPGIYLIEMEQEGIKHVQKIILR
ncbi:MAG: hypothetical protein K0R65_2996 [Crocinitomicaceae bacterium]|jgi:putative intracellular protease/amidase/type 1 glutamine amidotransferase|nr:hypothetical protein [Crocinitomicaceae bacterium]